MSSFEPPREVDLRAVQRDHDALDALAGRHPRGPSEGVHALLWALTADVDAGLEELLSNPLSELSPALVEPAASSIPDVEPVAEAEATDADDADDADESAAVISLADASRRRAARTVTALLLVTGLVSVSSVAAAVTGDPLSPYRHFMAGVGGEDENRPADNGTSALPTHVAAGPSTPHVVSSSLAALDEVRSRRAADEAGKRLAAARIAAAAEAKRERLAARKAVAAEREEAQAPKKKEKASTPTKPKAAAPQGHGADTTGDEPKSADPVGDTGTSSGGAQSADDLGGTPTKSTSGAVPGSTSKSKGHQKAAKG